MQRFFSSLYSCYNKNIYIHFFWHFRTVLVSIYSITHRAALLSGGIPTKNFYCWLFIIIWQHLTLDLFCILPGTCSHCRWSGIWWKAVLSARRTRQPCWPRTSSSVGWKMTLWNTEGVDCCCWINLYWQRKPFVCSSAEIGDYDDAADCDYLRANKLLPYQDKVQEKIMELHQRHL